MGDVNHCYKSGPNLTIKLRQRQERIKQYKYMFCHTHGTVYGLIYRGFSQINIHRSNHPVYNVG